MSSFKLPYMNLLRWLRETHVVVKNKVIELPLFRSTNQVVKIHFKRLSKTGFHHIDKVVVGEESPVMLSEQEMNNLLKQEAKFRVAAYASIADGHKDYHDEGYEQSLLSIKNCIFTENNLLNKKLFDISIRAQSTNHEDELIEQLREQIALLSTELASLYLESNFLPGVSDFFPMLDGIGHLDYSTPFDQIPRVSGGEQKGRIWLNNPLNSDINLNIIPRLDFFEPFELFDGWQMRDAQLEDLLLIHGWMNGPILSPTFRQNYSLSEWRRELTDLIASPFTRPMILSYQQEPSAYLELYRPVGMQVGRSFFFDPTEIGFHLGLVKKELINQKLGRKIIFSIINYLVKFPKYLVGGFVGEPDINNLSMFKATLGSGILHHAASIAMPHKCSYLVKYDSGLNLRGY